METFTFGLGLVIEIVNWFIKINSDSVTIETVCLIGSAGEIFLKLR